MALANNPFKKAVRANRKLRAAIDGVSGSGKSYTAMRLAQAMKRFGICKKIAVIDTEKQSMSLYSGEKPIGEESPWDFDTMNLAQYSPQQFSAGVKAAVANGYDCIIIDSWSHAWMGKDGALDIVDKKDGKFTAWKDVTPMIREMVETITGCDAHVIVTMRSKTEWVLEKEINKQGKEVTVPRKIGMAPVQKEGMEYEFDVYGTIDLSHQIKITKSRCSVMQDATAIKADENFWRPMFEWMGVIESNTATLKLESESSPPPAKHVLEETTDETMARLMGLIASAESVENLTNLGGTLKEEIGKLGNEDVEKVRAYFKAKRTELADAAEAAKNAPAATPAQQPVEPVKEPAEPAKPAEQQNAAAPQ